MCARRQFRFLDNSRRFEGLLGPLLSEENTGVVDAYVQETAGRSEVGVAQFEPKGRFRSQRAMPSLEASWIIEIMALALSNSSGVRHRQSSPSRSDHILYMSVMRSLRRTPSN